MATSFTSQDARRISKLLNDGAAERQRPLSDILRHLHQPIVSIDKLQADRRHRLT